MEIQIAARAAWMFLRTARPLWPDMPLIEDKPLWPDMPLMEDKPLWPDMPLIEDKPLWPDMPLIEGRPFSVRPFAARTACADPAKRVDETKATASAPRIIFFIPAYMCRSCATLLARWVLNLFR